MSKVQPTLAPPTPVTVQPIAYSEARKVPFDAWVLAPPQTAGFAVSVPGLELLSILDTMHIDQIVNMLEVITTYSTRKEYVIADSQNRLCYRAAEETSASMLIWCGSQREFRMHITDFNRNEVLVAHRVFKHCMGCICCNCCQGNAQQVNVSSRGLNLGSIVEVPACTRNQLEIRDANDQVIALILGPSCIPCNCSDACCKDVDFRIVTPDMATQLGSITRKYLGCWTHFLTTADSFTVNFTPNIDVKLKALIVGAVFLTDFRWFEVKRRNNQEGGLIGLTIAASVAASNGYNSAS